MVAREKVRGINQPTVPVRRTTRSLLLVSSGVVRPCTKESLMIRIRRRISKWGLMAAKVSLAAAVLAVPALPVHPDDEDSVDFGVRVERD